MFFHILESVGKTPLKEKTKKTVYSSCMDLEKGIYYYRTFENSRTVAVDMKKEDFNGKKAVFYPMIFENDIFNQN